MRPDDETSAEMEALRTQRLWHAFTGSDRRGPRSPLRRGLLGAAVVALVASTGAFVSGVIVAARDSEAATTTVTPTTTPAPTTTTTTPTTTTVPATTTTVGPSPTVVAVSATVPWTDSGVDVVPGEVLDVRASGVAFHSAGGAIGPDGDPRIELGTANRVTDGVLLAGRHCALIGRIGNGPPFVLGSSAQLHADVAGRLYLGVNDNGLDNNAGSFGVILTPATP